MSSGRSSRQPCNSGVVTDSGETWQDELERLRRELRDHPGTVAKQKWGELRRTIDLHQRNLVELEQVIAAPSENPALAIELIQNVAPPVVRDEYWAAMDQRLHNALASAVTVVDRARRLVDDYPGTAFAEEFARRNDRIRTDNRAVFVRRLRNYMLHYGLLPLAHQVSFGDNHGPNGLRFESQLSADALRAWGSDNWTAPAWAYLMAVGEHVGLAEMIAWYRDASIELHRWTLAQFPVLHGAAIDDANELVRRCNLLLSDGRDDGSDRWSV